MSRNRPPVVLSATAIVSLANRYRAAKLEPGPLLLTPEQAAAPAASKPKGRVRR